MPRRGEHHHDFPTIEEASDPARIGVRLVRGHSRRGEPETVRFDPAEFGCRDLAAELADEWVDYATITRLSAQQARSYCQAIREFCRTVDESLGDAAEAASLARSQPDLAFELTEWERRLPAGYRPGSMIPASLASAVRALIGYRAQHEHRPVDPRMRHLISGEMGVAWGAGQELDEFSRKDKRALVRAAWTCTVELEQRLATGSAWAARGAHPAEHGWTDVANLLWGLTHGEITPVDVRAHLPPMRAWPEELRSCIETSDRPVYAPSAKQMLARWLVRQLYPCDLDLHAFRILLVAATGGYAPEEVTGLTEDDVEFLPSGVRLTLTKQRAGRMRPHWFRDQDGPLPSTVVRAADDFVDRPHREVSTIVRRLLTVTEQARRLAGDREGWLFITAAVTPAGDLVCDRCDFTRPTARFRDWLAAAGVEVAGTPDVRRLRKSGKVEKALSFGGRVADAADDHHDETFRGHYAQGTTLRVLSGEVITTAQDHWFHRAVDGPTVVTDTEVLDEPDHLGTLGLTPDQAEDIRQGALDMGITQCRDPYDSPYSRTGELCAVAPLRCLECRNAWVLPSNLPQLLLFADHLDQLRQRLSPEHYAALWGQSHVNLHGVLAERTDEEKALARKHIQSGDPSLHLPLSAHAEFDA